MTATKTGSSRRNLIIAAIVLVAVAAGAWWFTSGPRGVPAEALQLAEQLPADTTLLVWTADLETLFTVAKDADFDGESLAEKEPLEGIVSILGQNPATAEGLSALGIDTGGSLGFFLGPMDGPDLLAGLFVPLKGTTGVAVAQDLAVRLGLDEHLRIQEGQEKEYTVSWVTRKQGNTPGALLAAILEKEYGAMIVFPIDRKGPHADRVGNAIQAWVPALAHCGEKNLANRDAFGQALDGYGDGLLGAYFNPSDGTREITLGDDGAQMAFWILASAEGAGLQIVDDGPTLRIQIRTVFSGKDIAPGMVRDRDVLDWIPGRPIAGLHLAIDLDKAIAELERSLPQEAFKAHSLVRAMEASGQALGLDEGKTFVDLLTGELGFFLGETEPDLASLLHASIGFIGIRDRAVAEGTLEGLLGGTGMMSGTETLEGATLFLLDGPMGEAGVMITDGRIWFAGSADALRGVARGIEGDITGGDRNSKLAALMLGDSSLALYVDLAAVTALLPIEGGPASGALADLDYLTMSGRSSGPTVESEVTLVVKGESFRKSLLPKLFSVVAGGSFGRKVEVDVGRSGEADFKASGLTPGGGLDRIEAHDTLEKMYQGAAMYFETPKVDMTGELLPCQFPEAIPWTPATSCCATLGGPDRDEDGRCDPGSDAWSSPTWSALRFEHIDPHRCVYSFESGGTGKDAWFKARARCDPDCDGEPATYTMAGRADPSSTDRDCIAGGGRNLLIQGE